MVIKINQNIHQRRVVAVAVVVAVVTKNHHINNSRFIMLDLRFKI
ncbi:hypothetical protein HY061_02395 [Candidatus Azambacteria bacterium]|nr:hypothetical protein [Candidatus Azambacteria bacterium]